MGKNTAKNRRELLVQLESMVRKIFENVEHDGAIYPHEKLGPKQSNMIRMQRAISWLMRDCDQLEHSDHSDDMSFILNWIAFESLYGKEQSVGVADNGKSSSPSKNGAVNEIMGFVANLEANETDRQRIIEAVDEVRSDIKLLFNNPFIDPANWARFYRRKTTKAGAHHNPFKQGPGKVKIPSKSGLNDRNKLDALLKDLFQRLYMLRNQLFHGNATHKGDENHDRASQIVSGAKVLRRLLPELILSMLSAMELYSDSERWGKVPYPRIRGIAG